MRMGSRRPCNSEKGAQTSGPQAYPKIYSELDSVATSMPTPNTRATLPVELEKTAESKVEQILVKARMIPVQSLDRVTKG
jgi:hypothetical protein